MLLAMVVLLNGSFVPSSPPVRRLFGEVMAPLSPVITRIADRVTLRGDDVVLSRSAQTCTFRIGSPAFRCGDALAAAEVAPFARDGIVFLPLAAVVRAFGGDVTFDSARATVAITMPARSSVATPAPFDATLPQVAPTQVFTPQPAAPTPQATATGDPYPRRTALPAIPSRVPG